MLSLDLFDSRYEKRLHEGALDDTITRTQAHLMEPLSRRAADIRTQIRSGKLSGAELDKLEKEYEDLVQQRLDIMLDRQPKNEQQVPSPQDPFAYVKPEPQGIGDIQDPRAKMAQLAQRTKKGPLANVATGIKAFVKGEPEPMGEEAQPRTHAQNVYFEILKAWEDERDYIVLPFPNAPNPVTMIRGQIWNAIVDLGSIKDPKRRAKYVEDRFNDFETFMSWLGNLKRYKVPAKKKGKTQSLPLQIPQQPTGQSQSTAPGSPLMDPEFTGIKPPGNLQEKKKSNDLEPKDVGLSRELQKARARFPAAASDLEAGILDQMDQQQQAQQALSQQQADLNRQDQQITSVTQTNQQQDGILRTQGQEIDRLTQRLQQVLTQPTATPAAAPVTPQAEPSAPATAPAPDMVYVPDVPADTATQDREIARLDKQIQQLELMMALKTPAERSDLEARILDLETARAEQEEKKRVTAQKSAATRQRKKQATTIDMEPTQSQLDYSDPSDIIGRVKLEPEQGAEVKAAQVTKDVIAKASRKPQTVETALNHRDPQGDYTAKRKALQDLGMNKDVDQAAVLQRRLDLDREAKSKGIAETVTDVKSGMARIYRRLAPKIEHYKDSFLAGQLYDELENYAELHGAEREFKQMMNSARNRAHMEYDTNPGGFQNWFWFLPFEDNMEEGIKSQLAGAALAGALALGAGSANARVTGDEDPGVNRLTGKPNVTQAVQGDQVKPSAPTGFSKEYLQSVVDGTHPRPMVSKEKAQALLNQLKEQGVAEGTDDIKKRMSKLEALALAANRAGDDAKCKMYQQKIQSLKQKLSQSMAEGKIKDIDIMRQDLDSMSDLQFFRAHDMKKDQFKYKYRHLLKPAPQQDVPVQESLRPGEYHIHTVYFKDGSKKRLRVTSDEFDVADYYTKRGQAVDRVDYDYQIHSDMTEQSDQPGTAIPRKSIIQGYTVYWNPTTQMVSVTRGGDSEQAAIEQARVKNINKDRFLAAAYRMIDRIEELAETITREPRTARERDDMIDKIQRMMTQDRNPANLQIMKKDIEMLKAKYGHLKEDSDNGEAVEMAIMRRMLVAHTDLIVEFGLDRVVAAIEEVAYDVGDVDEIGSSDVSGWVRQIERMLEADNEV